MSVPESVGETLGTLLNRSVEPSLSEGHQDRRLYRLRNGIAKVERRDLETRFSLLSPTTPNRHLLQVRRSAHQNGD